MHPVGVVVHGVCDVRPRPDEAHVALQHVPQLRKLVDARPAKECAHPRHAVISGDLVQIAGGAVAQQASHESDVGRRRASRPHRTELEDREEFPEPTDALGAVENGSIALESYRDRDGDENREKNEEQSCRRDDVDGPFR